MGPAFWKDLKNLLYLSISEYQGCGLITDLCSVLSSIILENFFFWPIYASISQEFATSQRMEKENKNVVLILLPQLTEFWKNGSWGLLSLSEWIILCVKSS